MEAGPLKNPRSGTDSQDSDVVLPPETNEETTKKKDVKAIPLTPKGVEIAKKRLRAFSIQKKSSLSPITVPKPSGTGNATVFIGKLAGAKPSQPKPEPDPTVELPKKPPKPPKPGARHIQENYINFQKKTLEEIEDMKRKMELVELGIPLGLICPAPNSDKAMPTKAMPPIKSFIATAKVDELIREAKKAKAEGREFKFDYQKLLPDYDNPFQRKKEEPPPPEVKVDIDLNRSIDKDKKRSDKYESRRHSYKDEKHRYRDKDTDKYRNDYKDKSKEKKKSKHSDSRFKDRERDKSKERDNRRKDDKSTVGESKKSEKREQETDVVLKDFLVCDSWSDHEEKSKDSTPENAEKKAPPEEKQLTPELAVKCVKDVDPILKLKEETKREKSNSPKPKMERLKLKPVIDAFKFEIEDPEDNNESLDIFDENLSTENFAKATKSKGPYDSPVRLFDDSKDPMDLADDTFLESVINEIKQEDIDDASQDKGLVEYDESPKDLRESVTPELNDKARELHSSRSDYSDGYKSVDSGCKSTESGYKSVDSLKLTEGTKSELDSKMPKHTVNSLETWSFVLKICQPLLFRHDKNKCYKETRVIPNLWFTENPKGCNCVKDRRVVYEELEMCKMDLVDSLYVSEQPYEWPHPTGRGWYPSANQCLVESSSGVLLSTEWEAEDSQTEPTTTPDTHELSLDKEYQRFMEAVWPEATERSETPRSTPVRREQKKKLDDDVKDDRKHKKVKLSSEGWSQESEMEEDPDKSTTKKLKVEKQKRKRKHSSTSVTDGSESDAKKRKKNKKKENKKSKSKDLIKRRRQIKKNIRKLKNKEKKKKKLIKIEDDSDNQDVEREKKKKEKRIRKKKQLKEKKRSQKKKKSKARSSSSSSSSTSDSEPEKVKKKKDKKKKRKQSIDSNPEELFDVNILNNIKTERLTDEEKLDLSFSPRKQKPREIINVKELQNDFVGIQIKKEVEERKEEERKEEEKRQEEEEVEIQQEDSQQSSEKAEEKELECEVKEPEEDQSTPQIRPEESNQSQCSSQESVYSAKDQPPYEKDESHLRPSSQNSNYSFHDVMASGHYNNHEKEEDPHESQEMPTLEDHSMPRDEEMDGNDYEHGDYEMYEQMAMAYQSDVASQSAWSSSSVTDPRRIETVVRARSACGEIKCDWRPGDTLAEKPHRPSRWGLKPGEVNIVLTGGGDYQHTEEPVYKIQSIANRSDKASIGYDEAYMDMYGASDRLQYGDCFSTNGEQASGSLGPKPGPLGPSPGPKALGPGVLGPGAAADPRRAPRGNKHTSTLDDRINLALRTTVLGEVAGNEEDKDTPDKGILVTKSLSVNEGRGVKRVSFADGYKPGQDSDTEEPPIKKKKKSRRLGCPWPCPASHPDHVPLWDALPPPPPPSSPPPPLAPPAPPAHLLRLPPPPRLLQPPHHLMQKLDPSGMPQFMPPEPPPGLISF